MVSLRSLLADKSVVRDDAAVAAKDRADVATLTAHLFEREHGCASGIVGVDQRGDTGAVADDRELTLAHRFDQPVVRGAVEAAVAQEPTVGKASRHLQELGILREVTGRARGKIVVYHDYLALLNEGTEG